MSSGWVPEWEADDLRRERDAALAELEETRGEVSAANTRAGLAQQQPANA